MWIKTFNIYGSNVHVIQSNDGHNGVKNATPPPPEFYKLGAGEETTYYVVIVSLLFSIFNITLGYRYVEILNDL